MECRVISQLSTGQGYFGTDTIKVVLTRLEHLLALSSRWLESDCEEPNWCGGLDLDQNAILNIIDFGLFDGCHIEFSNGLVGYWRFDESTGATAADAGPNNRSGTLVNMNPNDDWVTGYDGNALDFDGVDDYVVITDYKGILGTQSRTVAAWIKADEDRFIISWGDFPIAGGMWQVRIFDNGVNNVLGLGVFGGNINGTTELADNQWHHVAVTWSNDGTPNVTDAKLYVDGNEEAISSSKSQTINTQANFDVKLGATLGGVVPFSGLIDDVRIYNRALSAAEIMNLAN